MDNCWFLYKFSPILVTHHIPFRSIPTDQVVCHSIVGFSILFHVFPHFFPIFPFSLRKFAHASHGQAEVVPKWWVERRFNAAVRLGFLRQHLLRRNERRNELVNEKKVVILSGYIR